MLLGQTVTNLTWQAPRFLLSPLEHLTLFCLGWEQMPDSLATVIVGRAAGCVSGTLRPAEWTALLQTYLDSTLYPKVTAWHAIPTVGGLYVD